MEKELMDAMDKLHEYHLEVINHNNVLIGSLGELAQKEFNQVIQDCRVSDKITFVDEPKGDDQNENYTIFTNIHVDQWSIGDSSDSFAGFIYAKVNNKWICVPYDC